MLCKTTACRSRVCSLISPGSTVGKIVALPIVWLLTPPTADAGGCLNRLKENRPTNPVLFSTLSMNHSLKENLIESTFIQWKNVTRYGVPPTTSSVFPFGQMSMDVYHRVCGGVQRVHPDDTGWFNPPPPSQCVSLCIARIFL